jgi:CRISPR/Cas system endoribonuclease Cas6 (RAMP superfamily)
VRSQPRVVNQLSWAELSQPLGSNQWQVALLTPTAIRRDGIDQPWPAPIPLLEGLARKWAECSSSALPLTADDLRPVLVTGIELSTQPTTDTPAKDPVWGAVGMIEWTWNGRDRSAPPHGAHKIERLLRLAEFTGLGAYPQFGLGRVQVTCRAAHPGRLRGR